MLNHIIAVLVLDQLLSVHVELGKDRRGLFRRAVLQDPLDDSTPVGMCAEGVNLSVEGVDDELESIRLDTFNALLHDVISVLVFDALQHVPFEFANNFLLLLAWNAFQSLLNHTAPVHLQGEVENVAFDLGGQLGSLLLCAVFEELLNDVISEHVRHQTVSRSDNLVEHQLLLGRCRAFQLLLNESRTMLILRELDDVVGEVTELEIGVALVAELLEESRSPFGGVSSCSVCGHSSRNHNWNRGVLGWSCNSAGVEF